MWLSLYPSRTTPRKNEKCKSKNKGPSDVPPRNKMEIYSKIAQTILIQFQSFMETLALNKMHRKKR
jgi:hypothetical protein